MLPKLFDELNSIYMPVCEKAAQIKAKLTDAGFSLTLGFYNNHYVRRGDGFEVEHFPIPVISVADVGDIGVDIDSIWVETKLAKERAMLLDYPAMARVYKMEVYGADDFLNDFYNDRTDPRETAQKISSSDETAICVLLYFGLEVRADEIAELIRLFNA